MSVEISSGSKDRSLKQLVSDLRVDAGLLVRQEIALARAELKEKAVQFGVAGFLAYLGALVLLAAVVLGLVAIGVVAWLAALLVGVLVLFSAFMLVQRARNPRKAPPA